MDEQKKENFIHRFLAKRPWVYAFLLLVVVLLICAAVFNKVVMPIVAREHVEEYTVPMLEGLDSTTAIKTATDAGFKVAFKEEREYSNTYDINLVMRQNPPAEQKSKPGRTIHLTISDGLHQFTVPDLFDKNGEEAKEAIQKAGLNVGLTFETPHSNLAKGKVVRTNPSEGSIVHKGDTIDVFLSSGAKGEKFAVPEVLNLRLAIATANLRTAGFIVGKIERRKMKESQPGIVLEQNPAAGSTLSAGARINLVISE